MTEELCQAGLRAVADIGGTDDAYIKVRRRIESSYGYLSAEYCLLHLIDARLIRFKRAAESWALDLTKDGESRLERASKTKAIVNAA